MPNKPIIDIDINDKQFKEFYEMFQEFQEGIGTLPEEWKKVNAETKAAAKSFAAASGALVESMLRASHHAHDVTKQLKEGTLAQKQFQVATRHSESGLKNMAKEAKKVSDSIFGIGKFLFKTAAWGTGLFAGATFGADKLAGAAVGNQRSALGLGLTTGQYRAFNTDFGRYLNPSILGSVANAQNSYQGRMWLGMATGMGQSQLGSMNAADVSGRLAIKAHNWWNSTPSAQHTDANLKATGFMQSGLTLEDMRRLGATPLDQLQSAQAQFNRDSGTLNISGKSTNALYSFTRQLTLAGQKLETALTNKLTALAPTLGSFMTHLEKDAEILINGIFTDKNLRSIQNGLQTFANYLGSADFQSDVKSFGAGLKIIVNAISKAASILNPGTAGTGNAALAPTTEGLKQAAWAGNKYNDIQSGKSHLADKDSVVAHWLKSYSSSYGVNPAMLREPKKYKKTFSELEGAQNIPHGILSALAANESGFNPMALSSKGAQGLMQLMPKVSSALGVQNPYDPIQSAMGGAVLLHQLQKRYKGDIRKEIGAWNWNPSGVDKAVNTYGANWESHAPKETQNFINRVLRDLAQTKREVKITINNKSGTNVAVSANAAGI